MHDYERVLVVCTHACEYLSVYVCVCMLWVLVCVCACLVSAYTEYARPIYGDVWIFRERSITILLTPNAFSAPAVYI